MPEITKYYLKQSSVYDITVPDSDVSWGDTDIIPSQLWNGYHNQSVYAERKPSSINFPFVNFGKSILYYGCCVCCCAGASKALTGENHTIEEMYRKNLFVWNPKIVNDSGVPIGTILTRLTMMNRIGIKLNSLHRHYDYERTYSFAAKNSNYESFTPAQSSLIYVPEDSTVYSQGKGNYQKGNRTDLMDQTEYLKYQTSAFERIYNDLKQSSIKKIDMLYICSAKRMCGHFVLAYDYNGSQLPYSYEKVLVYDPCPTKYSKDLYYGKTTTLLEAMKRIGADISDGIRTIHTITAT